MPEHPKLRARTIIHRCAYVVSMALLVFAIVYAASPAVRADITNALVNVDGSGYLDVDCKTGCGAGGSGAPLTGASQNVTPAASQSAGVHLSRLGDGALDALQPNTPGTFTNGAITGSGSTQSVPVLNNTAPYIPINSYVWIYGKTDTTPDYVQVTAEADVSHISAVIPHNHVTNAMVLPAGAQDFVATTAELQSLSGGGILPEMPVKGATPSMLFGWSSGSGGTQWQSVNTDGSGNLNVNLGAVTTTQYSVLSASNQSGAKQVPVAAFVIGQDIGTSNSTTIRENKGQLLVTDGGATRTKLTATVCTSITASAAILDKEWSAASGETATLSIYDEGSSPTCAAADLVWSGVPSAGLPILDLGIPMTSGIAYKLSAAAANNDYLTSN